MSLGIIQHILVKTFTFWFLQQISVVIISFFVEFSWVLNRTPEVDSSDSKNPNVLIQMAGRNINTNNALSIGSHFPIVFFVRYLYSSILFDFKAFTKGSVFPLAMFKDVVQMFRPLFSKGRPTWTHFPQRGLNLKSCVLPISLQEPLKHL